MENKVKKLEEQRTKLFIALTILYEENKNYIEANHLGDPHHNMSMKLAKEAIDLVEAQMKEEGNEAVH